MISFPLPPFVRVQLTAAECNYLLVLVASIFTLFFTPSCILLVFHHGSYNVSTRQILDITHNIFLETKRKLDQGYEIVVKTWVIETCLSWQEVEFGVILYKKERLILTSSSKFA